jgi:hypothetical protein
MTATHDSDRIVRAWLDLMPDEAPDHAIAAVLDEVAVTPQAGPWLRPIRRPLRMTRMLIAACVAVLVAAVGGAVLLNRSPSTSVAGPSPSATASSPAATLAAVPSSPLAAIPASLADTWLGDARTIPGLGLAHKPEIVLSAGGSTDAGTFVLSGAKLGGALASQATSPGAGPLRLVTTEGDECLAGAVGTYPLVLSPGGRILTISSGSDTCAARESAVPGTWYRSDPCHVGADGCFGQLEAGTWMSQTLDARTSSDRIGTWQPTFGSLTYTVPDGWSNPIDNRGRFNLVPASQYELPQDQRTLFVWMFPRVEAAEQDADQCPYAAVTRPIPQTADAFTKWIAARPSVVAGPIHDITIDGHPGRWLDVSIAPSWKRTCDWSNGAPYATLIFSEHGDTGIDGVGVGEADRYVFVDTGEGRMVDITLTSLDPARTESFFAEAMPIIQSFHFN